MLSELRPLPHITGVPARGWVGGAVLCEVLPCAGTWGFNFWADSLKMQYPTLNGKVTKHRVVRCKRSVLVPTRLHLLFPLSFFSSCIKMRK